MEPTVADTLDLGDGPELTVGEWGIRAILLLLMMWLGWARREPTPAATDEDDADAGPVASAARPTPTRPRATRAASARPAVAPAGAPTSVGAATPAATGPAAVPRSSGARPNRGRVATIAAAAGVVAYAAGRATGVRSRP